MTSLNKKYMITVIVGMTVLGSAGCADFCLFDTFTAECNDSQKILMQEAQYGRKYTGTCIPDGADHIGCHANVLTELDDLCSGRQYCSLPVQHFEQIVHGCPQDRYKFLEAHYICINESAEQNCSQTIEPQASGHLAGKWPPDRDELVVTSSLGTVACPWKLSALPGQHIRLRLIDISLRRTLESHQNYQRDVCPLHLVVMEIRQLSSGDLVTGHTRHVQLCNEDDVRESLLYESHSNAIEMYVEAHDDQPRDATVYFIHYEVFGCAHVTLPENTWSERDGDTLVVRCNDTLELWYLVCREQQWHGYLGNCTIPTLAPVTDTSSDDDDDISIGLIVAIAVGVGIGIIVGLVMLAVLVALMKCCTKQPQHAPSLSQIQVPYTPGANKQDQYDDIGQSSRPGSSHRISRTLAAPLPPIPGQSTADDLHDHSARSPYHVYNYYDTHNPGVGAMDDETQCARIGPPSEPCSEHIYESAYSTRLNQAQTTTPSGSDTQQRNLAQYRQKSLAKEYYEMRGSPQNTLESSDQQQLRY